MKNQVLRLNNNLPDKLALLERKLRLFIEEKEFKTDF